TPYYESIENAMKIRKYVKQRNVAQLPKTQQEIISRHQEAATTYDDTATESLKKAIENAEFYVDGEHLTLRGTDPKSKLDQAMEYLVVHVYSELDLIAEHVSYDSDITQIATSTSLGDVGNVDAAAKVEEYLLTRFQRKLPTTMSDVQSRYQAVPYGWKEIDIAAVVALLVHDQKVTLKYAGNTVQPTDPRLPDLLRKRSEIGRTQISIRQAVSAANIKEAREFLREYFDRMDIPTDEDALIAYIVDHFTAQKSHYESLLQRYDGHRYPDQNLLQAAVTEIKELLTQQKDNVALITKLIKMEDTFYDRKDSLQNIEDFFQNQVTIFDGAVQYWNDLLVDKDYLSEHEEAYAAFNKINLYTRMETGARFNYKRIPELGGLVATVRQTHDALLEEKRKELYGIIQDCQAAIRRASKGDRKAQDVLDKADDYYSYKQSEIAKTKQLVVLDGIMPQLWIKRDDYVASVEIAIQPPKPVTPPPPVPPKPKPPKRNRNVYRQAVFPAETLSSEEEIDAYLEKVRDYMLVMLRGYDGLKLN
ncbi:MAG: BREX system P-loop protein BrxC, partial [Clostridia bacterium]|nr:BREX system P-loop protein BrxC [Clostridia bacterium]